MERARDVVIITSDAGGTTTEIFVVEASSTTMFVPAGRHVCMDQHHVIWMSESGT